MKKLVKKRKDLSVEKQIFLTYRVRGIYEVTFGIIAIILAALTISPLWQIIVPVFFAIIVMPPLILGKYEDMDEMAERDLDSAKVEVSDALQRHILIISIVEAVICYFLMAHDVMTPMFFLYINFVLVGVRNMSVSILFKKYEA